MCLSIRVGIPLMLGRTEHQKSQPLQSFCPVDGLMAWAPVGVVFADVTCTLIWEDESCGSSSGKTECNEGRLPSLIFRPQKRAINNSGG